jgi:hypothetical protein
VLFIPHSDWQLFVMVSPSFSRAWSSISIAWKWRWQQESFWTDRALCPRSLILRVVVKEWCSEVFYHSTEVICLKSGHPKTRCPCAAGVFNHVSSSLLLWWFPPIILFHFHSLSYLSLFRTWRISWRFVTSGVLCEVLEVLLGLEIVLQEFANSDSQKCFRQLYRCQQKCVAVEEQYFECKFLWKILCAIRFKMWLLLPTFWSCYGMWLKLLSSYVEFEISLETLHIHFKLMLFSLQVYALNHPILTCFRFLWLS